VRLPILLILLALAGLLAGCGDDDSAGADAEAELAVRWVAPDGEPPYIGLLSVNPADGTLLMGTNTGLFKVPADGGTPQKVTGELTTPQGTGQVSEALVARYVGPDQLIASGHPPSGSSLPEVLGLIRSEDDGKTWESVSELGTADFHALARSGDLLVAPLYGQAQILVSRDEGKTFQTRVALAALVDLAVDPGDAKRWAATSEQGVFASLDEGRTWRQRDPTPNVPLAWAKPDELYRIDPGGPVKVSADGGETWEDRGSTGGEPHALTVAEDGTMYAAELRGNVHRSDDGGATWRLIVKGG
jgi:photosystem II stability/assembly factor-like uncharacterized protein